MTCTDVYLLAQPCGPVLYAYPQQVHPPLPPVGGASGGGHPRTGDGWRSTTGRDFIAPRPTDDEDVAVLIALGVL